VLRRGQAVAQVPVPRHAGTVPPEVAWVRRSVRVSAKHAARPRAVVPAMAEAAGARRATAVRRPGVTAAVVEAWALRAAEPRSVRVSA
jgi:hypothetical protein